MTTSLHAIRVNLALIAEYLERATEEVESARRYAEQGNQNVAVGSLPELGTLLANASALRDAVYAIHRDRHLLHPQQQGD